MKIVHLLAHLFIPRESNNQKAKLLHPSSLTTLTFLLVIFQVFLTLGNKFGPQVLGYAANIPPLEIIRLTNEKRMENGLAPLKENGVLSQAALAKGNDMIAKGYWAHVSPDGVQPWKFFTDAGYEYRYAGENLARDFSDPTSTVNAWMASASHKENMLSDKYKEIGVAVVEGNMNGVDTTIVVQFFGTKYGDTLPRVPVAGVKEVATSIPSVLPLAQPLSLAESTKSPVVFSPFTTTKGVSLVLVSLLLVILLVDGVVVSLRRVSRVGGRTLAHMAFLGMILVIIIILKAGEII